MAQPEGWPTMSNDGVSRRAEANKYVKPLFRKGWELKL